MSISVNLKKTSRTEKRYRRPIDDHFLILMSIDCVVHDCTRAACSVHKKRFTDDMIEFMIAACPIKQLALKVKPRGNCGYWNLRFARGYNNIGMSDNDEKRNISSFN